VYCGVFIALQMVNKSLPLIDELKMWVGVGDVDQFLAI
jgi:hypothetical protein